jgi:hypothetical protein
LAAAAAAFGAFRVVVVSSSSSCALSEPDHTHTLFGQAHAHHNHHRTFDSTPPVLERTITNDVDTTPLESPS